MRLIQPGETGRALAFDTFGLDWQTKGYTLTLEVRGKDKETRTATIAASVDYPLGGVVEEPELIFLVGGIYRARIYDNANAVRSEPFNIPIGSFDDFG